MKKIAKTIRIVLSSFLLPARSLMGRGENHAGIKRLRQLAKCDVQVNVTLIKTQRVGGTRSQTNTVNK